MVIHTNGLLTDRIRDSVALAAEANPGTFRLPV